MPAIETLIVNGHLVEIHPDEDSPNPRTEFDHLGTMVCLHKRYGLGDVHSYRSQDFTGWGALKAQIIRDHDPVAILPLYLFDHSGITISTSAERFRAWDGAGWDWGQVGWIYMTRKKALDNWSRKRISKGLRQKAEEVLEAEVEEYDQYLRGDVYFALVHADESEDSEVVDSCGGLFGIEYAKEFAQRETATV
jgi:hypothetical protein